jgi:lysyl-tRNA synthetase class 2
MADWRPTADWPMLERRAALLRRLRAFFDERGFLEVETPLLSADAVVDRHLDPIEAVCDGTVVEGGREPGQGGTRRFLQTSPEFALKRLMAAGGKAIYQVAHAFRRGEFGRLHNPEFTLVEWYRRGDDLAAGMRLLSDLAEALLARGPAERLTYADAFSRWAGIDPLVPDIPAWAELLRRAGVEPPASFAADDPDAWLDLILLELVEPQLGHDRPIIIYDYPVSQPNVSSSTTGGSSWRTATTSCSTRRCCASGTGRTMPGACVMANKRCRKKAGCWRQWKRDCRPRPAWPWGSTGS